MIAVTWAPYTRPRGSLGIGSVCDVIHFFRVYRQASGREPCIREPSFCATVGLCAASGAGHSWDSLPAKSIIVMLFRGIRSNCVEERLRFRILVLLLALLHVLEGDLRFYP
jgi:hypothetical protein